MNATDFGQLLKEHPEMLDDGKKFAAILRDVYPSEKGNVNQMIIAYNAGVVSMLRKSDLDSLLTSRIMSLLMDDYGIAEERARWAAELWMEAYYLFQQSFQEKETDSNLFKVKVTGDSCIITKYTGSDISQVIIPARIHEKSVTGIGMLAFSWQTALTKVIIPNSVTEIGLGAFLGCAKLSSITVPKSVTRIKPKAFEYTPWLKKLGDYAIVNKILVAYQGLDKNVVVPEGVSAIGEGAFSNNNLECVIIPEGVTSIGISAFSGCENLSSIIIPEGVTDIGSFAFRGCVHLANIIIPRSVTEIGIGTFMDTHWIKRLGDYAIINNILIEYQGSDRNVIVPEGTRVINRGAFVNCADLISITIPSSVTTIYEMAFDSYEGFTIYAPAESCAEKYAGVYGIPFRAI